MKITSVAIAAILSLTFASPTAAQESSAPSITPISMRLEAGTAFYEAWSSGTTIHSGVGYIDPYGSTDYWCGIDYAEAEAFPDRMAQNAELLGNSRDSAPLFCVYRAEGGDIYVLDVLIGSIERREGSIERVDAVVNVVLGGTGVFEDASEFWVGTTSGRGEGNEVAPGISLPDSILKLMEGFVRVPAEAPAD